MNLFGRRESDNVDDRRGMGGGAKAGLGIGGMSPCSHTHNNSRSGGTVPPPPRVLLPAVPMCHASSCAKRSVALSRAVRIPGSNRA